MDRMIYIAMAGAKQAFEQQASVAHNMANVSTPGFRAQINSYRAVPVVGEEAPIRVSIVATTPGADLRSGPIQQTGRALDVAIKGDGWLAVQLASGEEAYTRAGSLQLGADGQLTTLANQPVLGDGGPIVVPPGAAVTVGVNGAVYATAQGDQAAGTAAEVGQLKLVNPPTGDLVRGDDGLFRMREGAAAPAADAAVTLLTGAVEGSNVNPVEAMVDMIANARRLEMQMKSLQTADGNAQIANKLLSYN